MVRARAQYDQLTRASADTSTETAATTAATDQFNRALGRASDSAAKTTGTTSGLKTGIDNAGAAAEATSTDITKLKNAIQQLLDTAFGAPRSLDAFQSKLNNLSKTVKENGTSLQGTSDKAIANRAAFYDAADAIGAFADAALQSGQTPATVAAKVQHMTDKLIGAAGAAGYSKSQVKALTDTLNDLPGVINPKIILDAAEAQSKAQALKNLLNSFHDITANVNVKAHTSNLRELEQDAGVPQMASGGVVTSPTLALIGEGNQSEAVLPLDVLKGMLGKVYAAGKTTVGGAQQGAGGSSGSGGGGGQAAGQRIISGRLSLDKSGHAFIRGVAEDVADGNDQFARAYARMGG
jgi:hypothetical protein